ncbi:hypothetical protein [Burkholderia phage FLC9]|nr:hypothetical protein [Burkholderia phage FLC9]
MTTENQQPNSEQQANGILGIVKTTAPAPGAADIGASGTLTSTGVTPAAAPEAPVVAEPTPVKPAAPTVSELTSALQKARLEATPSGTMVIDQIAAYMDQMAPKKLQEQRDIVRAQVQLYRALTRAINTLTDDFYIVWKAILATFHEHKDGVFHESAVFRGMEHITLPKDDIKGFQRLLNLIKITANPAGRNAAIKQVEFGKTLEFGITEAGRQKLLNFYNK